MKILLLLITIYLNTVYASGIVFNQANLSLNVENTINHQKVKLNKGSLIQILTPINKLSNGMIKIKIKGKEGSYRVSRQYLFSSLAHYYPSLLRSVKYQTNNSEGKVNLKKGSRYVKLSTETINGKTVYKLLRVNKKGILLDLNSRATKKVIIYDVNQKRFHKIIQDEKDRKAHVAAIKLISKLPDTFSVKLSPLHGEFCGIGNEVKLIEASKCVSLKKYQCVKSQCYMEDGFMSLLKDWKNKNLDYDKINNIKKCVLTQIVKRMDGQRGFYQCENRLDAYNKIRSKKKYPCVTNNMADVVSTEMYQAAQCLNVDIKKYLPLIGHESYFLPNIQSHSGAVGIGQLTANSIQDVNQRSFKKVLQKKQKPGCEYLNDIKHMPENKYCARLTLPDNPRANIVYSMIYLNMLRNNYRGLTASKRISSLNVLRKNKGIKPFTKKQKEKLTEELVQAMYNGGIQRSNNFSVFMRNPNIKTKPFDQIITEWRKYLLHITKLEKKRLDRYIHSSKKSKNDIKKFKRRLMNLETPHYATKIIKTGVEMNKKSGVKCSIY